MRALVTGGGGFLGSAIVRRLLGRGVEVVILGRGDYPSLQGLGASICQGDISDEDTVRRALKGCAVVFHVAARAGIWGPAAEYERTNIRGTENVIRGCLQVGVPRLIYTSSPSVVFTGDDQCGIDESTPYPVSYKTDYPRTKAVAEQRVLQANTPQLQTVALRPHLIWGPGDQHLIPRIVDRARKGQLRRVGSGRNLVDTCYIDNAADAHLLAFERLAPGSPLCGRAYFIAQGEPMPLWDLINRILAAAQLPPVTKGVPATLAYAVGGVLEGWHRLFCPTVEPRMTRFVARELSTSHWFNLDAARRDLGYKPRVTVAEGLERLSRWFAGSLLCVRDAH